MRRSSLIHKSGIAAALILVSLALPSSFELQAAREISAVSEGNWHGTWAYENRDQEFAFFFREENDQLFVRVYHRSRARQESFLTDWNGHAGYTWSGRDAVFDFKITRFDDTTIEGTWNWSTPMHSGQREEQATVRIYRYDDGRLMLAQFPDLLKTRRREGLPKQSREIPTTWSFRKVSKRIIRTEELPF
jgi:hypothetical protein